MNKEGEVFLNSLVGRWVASGNQAAGTTCVANSPSTATPNGQHNLTALSYSLRNMTAASVTCTLSVRDASIAGTVLLQMDFVQAANAASQGTFANLDLPGLKGNQLWAEFGTPASSITQKIAMCGWEQAFR